MNTPKTDAQQGGETPTIGTGKQAAEPSIRDEIALIGLELKRPMSSKDIALIETFYVHFRHEHDRLERELDEAYTTLNEIGVILPLKDMLLVDAAKRLVSERDEALRQLVSSTESMERAHGLLMAFKNTVIKTIGGTVDGQPTHEGNYLQRLRELISKEILVGGALAANADLRGQLTALRQQLADAQKEVGELRRERDEACQVITDLRLGPPGGKPVSPGIKAALEQMNDEAAERYSKKGNLEKK